MISCENKNYSLAPETQTIILNIYLTSSSCLKHFSVLQTWMKYIMEEEIKIHLNKGGKNNRNKYSCN